MNESTGSLSVRSPNSESSILDDEAVRNEPDLDYEVTVVLVMPWFAFSSFVMLFGSCGY